MKRHGQSVTFGDEVSTFRATVEDVEMDPGHKSDYAHVQLKIEVARAGDG